MSQTTATKIRNPNTQRHALIDQHAGIEARRWALITARQIDRYVDAAEAVGGPTPVSTNVDSLRGYYERYDRLIAEAHFVATAAIELIDWLRMAGITRKGERGADVRTIRKVVAGWDAYRSTERSAKRAKASQNRAAPDRTDLLDAQHLFGTVSTKTAHLAATSLAEELDNQLRAAG